MAGSIAITMKPSAASAPSSTRSTTSSACTRRWATAHPPSSRLGIERAWGRAWATLRDRRASRRPRPITALTSSVRALINDHYPSVRSFAVSPKGCTPKRVPAGFPPLIWRPWKSCRPFRCVGAAAGADCAAPVEGSMPMNIMPILCRPRSAGIRHNIAQFCQASCRSVRRTAPNKYAPGAGVEAFGVLNSNDFLLGVRHCDNRWLQVAFAAFPGVRTADFPIDDDVVAEHAQEGFCARIVAGGILGVHGPADIPCVPDAGPALAHVHDAG